MSSFASLRAERDRRHAPQIAQSHAISSAPPDNPPALLPSLASGSDRPFSPTPSLIPDTPLLSNRAIPAKAAPSGSGSTWTADSNKSKPFIEFTTQHKGRGLYTPGGHKAGAIIEEFRPLQAVPSTSRMSDVCSGCLLTVREIDINRGSGGFVDPVKPCSDCHLAVYCSLACEKMDRLDHDAECRIFQAMLQQDGPSKAVRIPSEAVRALGRLCLARKRDRQREGTDPDWWKDVVNMENHVNALAENDGFEQIFGLVRQLGNYLAYSVPFGTSTSKEALFKSFGFEETVDLLKLCSAFQVNSFTLSLPSVTPIGVAICPTVALANHSCHPNAVVVFPEGGRHMRLVAIRQLEPGEEILTAYIDVSLPYEKRQAELSSTYRFTCKCDVCEKDLLIREKGYEGRVVDKRASTWHAQCKNEKKGCGTLPFAGHTKNICSMRCEGCSKSFTFDPTPHLGPYAQAVALVDSDAKGHRVPLSAVQKGIFEMGKLMPPSSYPLLQLIRMGTLHPPNCLDDVHRIGELFELVVWGSERVFPPNHPVLAILYAEWGQVLAQTFEDEPEKGIGPRLMAATKILRQAFELCGKAFGPGGGVEGKQVAYILRETERELEMARRASSLR